MKLLSLNSALFTGLLLATVACGEAYSNLSPSGSHSGKSSHTDVRSGDSSNDSTPSRGGRGSSDSAIDLVRGSSAWFAHESVEHALKLAVTNQADAAASISSTSSVIQGQTSTVEITLTTGAKLSYTCSMVDSSSRSGTVLKKDVLPDCKIG